MYLAMLITVLRFPFDLARALICLPFTAITYCQRKMFWRPLKDEVVLITGASSGIGRALARELYVNRGCRVALAARNVAELENFRKSLVKEASANRPQDPNNSIEIPMVLKLDVTDSTEELDSKVNEVVSTLSRIDFLINCAGMSVRGSVNDTSMSTHRRIMEVDYFGMVNLTKCVIPHMLGQGRGRVVQISSLQGLFAIPNRSAYSAAKHAMQAFSDSLRAEVSHLGVGVTVVSPGYVRTQLSVNALTGSGDKHGVLDKDTDRGYAPEYVAWRIGEAMAIGEDEIVIAPLLHRFVSFVRFSMPWLYFKVMSYRAIRQEANKNKAD